MSQKRILIVEDSMEIGRMLQAALKTMNTEYAVTWMRSAEEAILETSRHNLDLVITDIRLPGIDGFELIRRIRRRLPLVHVIIVSGLPEHELRKQVAEVKPDVVLVKPVEVNRFLQAVTDVLEAAPASAPAPEAQKAPETSPDTVNTPVSAPPADSSRLSELLTRLHTAAGAQMVLLLDAEGVNAADVGAPQKGLAVESKAIRDVLAATGGLTLTGPRSQMIVRGTRADWILQPVGTEFTLALLLPGGSSLLRLAVALEEVSRAHEDLRVYFGQPVPARQTASEPAAPQTASAAQPQPSAQAAQPAAQAEPAAPATVQPPEPEPEPVVEDPAALEAFAALFGEASAPAPQTDAASFWDSALEGGPQVSINPQAITFEQAQQMGLAPGSEEES